MSDDSRTSPPLLVTQRSTSLDGAQMGGMVFLPVRSKGAHGVASTLAGRATVCNLSSAQRPLSQRAEGCGLGRGWGGKGWLQGSGGRKPATEWCGGQGEIRFCRHGHRGGFRAGESKGHTWRKLNPSVCDVALHIPQCSPCLPVRATPAPPHAFMHPCDSSPPV